MKEIEEVKDTIMRMHVALLNTGLDSQVRLYLPHLTRATGIYLDCLAHLEARLAAEEEEQ